MTDTPPTEFNWVKARHECSIGAVFRQLQEDASKDVEQMNEFLPQGATPFVLNPYAGGDRFDISRGRTTLISIVIDGTHIRVEDVGKHKKFSATIGMNRSGQCKLRVNGEEVERWQFLLKALEEPFFETPETH